MCDSVTRANFVSWTVSLGISNRPYRGLEIPLIYYGELTNQRYRKYATHTKALVIVITTSKRPLKIYCMTYSCHYAVICSNFQQPLLQNCTRFQLSNENRNEIRQKCAATHPNILQFCKKQQNQTK